MEEKLGEFLCDVFCKNFEIVSRECKQNGDFYVINCNLDSSEAIKSFIESYMEETNETFKLKYKKNITDKSKFRVKEVFRCHHDTRYENTRDATAVFEKKPFQRFSEIHVVRPKFLLSV